MKFSGLWRHYLKSGTVNKANDMSLLDVVKPVRPLKISVEGNIGSGKSTFLNYFKQFPFVATYSEPLEKWRDVQGHNLLGLLYEDMQKWSGTFQSYVLLTRTEIQSLFPSEGITIQMFERSVQNNRFCFLENAFNSGSILPAQYAVLCKWYEWIKENVDISLDLIVYLRTSPEVVYRRVLNRNRSEEKTVSLDYLKSLHLAHEKWLSDPKQSIPVLQVDADKCFDDIIESCQKNMPALFNSQYSVVILQRALRSNPATPRCCAAFECVAMAKCNFTFNKRLTTTK